MGADIGGPWRVPCYSVTSPSPQQAAERPTEGAGKTAASHHGISSRSAVRGLFLP